MEIIDATSFEDKKLWDKPLTTIDLCQFSTV